jgi:2'-5' RNA ligase
VVAAAFDRDSERAIAGVRDSLVVTGDWRRRPSGRPHLTLSAARVPRPHRVIDVATDVAARHRAFPLVLSEFGEFTQVVWLGPKRTRRLSALHRDAWQSMIDAGWPPAFAGQSDPATWVPHCTLVRGELAEPPATARVETRVTELLVLVVGRGEAARIPLG